MMKHVNTNLSDMYKNVTHWFNGCVNIKSNKQIMKQNVLIEINDAIDDFYNTYGRTGIIDDIMKAKEPVIYGNLESKKTILLVDDQCTVFYLYDLDFKAIKERFNYDILKEFKIVKCDGNEAGFTASEYIKNKTDEIVIGILDLTLGTIVKLEDGSTLIYDGVDLALELIELHSKCKIGICTAHMIDAANPAISSLINKFNTATGHSLLDYAFSKNSDRAKHIYKLINDVEHNRYNDTSSGIKDV